MFDLLVIYWLPSAGCRVQATPKVVPQGVGTTEYRYFLSTQSPSCKVSSAGKAWDSGSPWFSLGGRGKCLKAWRTLIWSQEAFSDRAFLNALWDNPVPEGKVEGPNVREEDTEARKPELGSLLPFTRAVIWDKLLGPFIHPRFPS